MQRKLVQQGSSTLMVSLPSKWAKKNNLSKGSLIELQENKSTITISISKNKKKKNATLNLNESSIISRRILLSLYKEGYDEIEINFSQPLIAEIEKIVGQLIGFEIIKQEKNYCKIQDITGNQQTDINILLRRLFLLTKSMANDSLEAIENNDLETLKHIEYRDYDINKFSYFCQRLLTKQNNPKSRAIYQTTDSLEVIGDEYKKISWYITKNKTKLTPKEIQLYSEINKFFNMCYQFVYTLKEKDVAQIRKKYQEINKTLTGFKTTNPRILHYLENITEQSIKIERNYLPFLKNIQHTAP